MIHRSAEHHHCRVCNPVRQERAILIRLRRAAPSPRRAEIRGVVVGIDIGNELLKLLLVVHLTVLAADVPLLSRLQRAVRILVSICVSHATEPTRTAYRLKGLPDGDAILWRNIHGRILCNLKGLVELRNIGRNEVAAELRRRVRVNG